MRRPRFSLKSIFGAMTLVAVVCVIRPVIVPHCGKSSTSTGVECNWYYWGSGSGIVVFVELPESSTFLKRSPIWFGRCPMPLDP